MASLNKVLLIGRLTRDPVKRSTPSGMTVAELSVAVNRRYRASNGEDREETCFVDVTVWGKQAESCAENLRKGSPLFIEGRLKLDEWEKDGQKRSKLSVVAERVQFLDGGRRATSGGGDFAADRTANHPRADVRPTSPPPPPDEAESDDLPF